MLPREDTLIRTSDPEYLANLSAKEVRESPWLSLSA